MLDEAKLVGKELCQCEIDYKSGCTFYGLFLASKLKYSSTIDKNGINQQHMTFTDFNGSERLLLAEKVTVMLPKSWKKSFDNGIIIPVKMSRCDEC